MSRLEEILEYNRNFVQNKRYGTYRAGRYPRKKLVVVTCMDTRLTELLPRALDIRNGDAKVLKTAGALITDSFGSLMRSLLVGITKLKVREILVIGHYDCGMVGLTADQVLDDLVQRGVAQEEIASLNEAGIDVDKWLSGCKNVETGVMESIKLIQTHPLLPKDVLVHGLLIHPETGELTLIHDGR